jgi:Flp pilus assembly secretin CpaC
MRRTIPLLLSAAVALIWAAGEAAARPVAARAVVRPGEMTLEISENRLVTLGGEAATVVVDDPRVADVAMSDAHSLVLIGRGQGVTRVVVTGRNGRVLLASLVTVSGSQMGRVSLFRGVDAYDVNCVASRCRQIGPNRTPAAGSANAGVFIPPAGQGAQSDDQRRMEAIRTGGEAAEQAQARAEAAAAAQTDQGRGQP